jgi:hypothetical protein
VSAWRTVIRPNQPPKLLRHDKDRMVYVLKVRGPTFNL